MAGCQKLDLVLHGTGLALDLIAYRMKEELILVPITISVSFLRLTGKVALEWWTFAF